MLYGGYPQKSIALWIPFPPAFTGTLYYSILIFSCIYIQPLPLNLALSIRKRKVLNIENVGVPIVAQ